MSPSCIWSVSIISSLQSFFTCPAALFILTEEFLPHWSFPECWCVIENFGRAVFQFLQGFSSRCNFWCPCSYLISFRSTVFETPGGLVLRWLFLSFLSSELRQSTPETTEQGRQIPLQDKPIQLSEKYSGVKSWILKY